MKLRIGWKWLAHGLMQSQNMIRLLQNANVWQLIRTNWRGRAFFRARWTICNMMQLCKTFSIKTEQIVAYVSWYEKCNNSEHERHSKSTEWKHRKRAKKSGKIPTIFPMQEHNSVALFKKIRNANERKKGRRRTENQYLKEAETTKLTRTVCSL